jgi:Outer membrane protein beta-barrel domain
MTRQTSLVVGSSLAQSARTFKSFLLMSMWLAAPCAVLAQPAAAASSATFADGLSITPQNGQSSEQQIADRTACEAWSKGQTGFDITQPTGGVTPSNYTSRRDQFDRAMVACLEARGYAVRIAPPPPAPATYSPPPYGAPAPSATYKTAPPAPYQPFHVSISGGLSITADDGSENFDDGGLVDLGFSFFPIEVIPIGLRVDGSYSWYGARDRFLYANNAQIGHQEVYGGDVDLQFNLGPYNARSQFYLFGGGGWYRERITLHQVSGFGGFCDFYCGGLFITGTARETTPWRDSWNAGLGWELALTSYSKFFVEARYRKIGPNDSKESFVPIQAGIRF